MLGDANRIPMSARDLGQSPEKILDLTITEMHSISNADLQTLHLEGLSRQFQNTLGRVPMLTRLAEEQGVDSIQEITDAAHLLVAHTVYKSYPLSVIERDRYDQMTRWLNMLTAYDLSGVNATSCCSIDEWIDLLDAKTDLRVRHSSGTTGKLSFLPRNLLEYESSAKGFRRLFEGFGDEPDASPKSLKDTVFINAGYRRGGMNSSRLMDALLGLYHAGDESFGLAQFPGRMSADVMSLGGRLNAAEQRGELGKMQLSPGLQARRDQFLKERENLDQVTQSFHEKIKALRGQRVVLIGTTGQMFDMADAAHKAGLTKMFSPDSLVYLAGGLKGRTLPDFYQDTITQFVGADVYPRNSYGMTEMVNSHRSCPFGNYHLRPNVVPFVLDAKTGMQLPRTGVQKGRFGFVDLLIKMAWGGFLSGDEVTLHWGDAPCACGRTGAFIEPEIRRYAESEGGDDKITCSGAPEAHDRALDFIAHALG